MYTRNILFINPKFERKKFVAWSEEKKLIFVDILDTSLTKLMNFMKKPTPL